MRARRAIGFWTCTSLVVGNVIGMGIFVLPASLAPFGFNALVGWAIVLVGCLLLARVFSHLARALPEAEGPYGYIRATLGELPAYVALWAYWVSLWLTIAALATGVVGYLDAVSPVAAVIHPPLLATGLMWAIVAVNLCGVRAGGNVQIVTTMLKLLPMLAIAGIGAWLLFTAPANYTAHLPSVPITTSSVVTASTLAMFAMLGIESACIPAARVADPARTLPRATMAGTVLVSIIYVIVCSVPLLLLGSESLAHSSAPFALLMDRFATAGTGRWLALFVVISGVGAINGWTLLSGELLRTMAYRGTLPAVLARNNRFGAPATAIVLTAVLSTAMVWMSYSKSLVAAFTFLSQVVTAANLPVYLGCALALAALWRQDERQPRRIGILAIAVASVAFVAFIFVGAGREPFLYALGLCAAGLPIYAATRGRRRTTMDKAMPE